MMNLKLEQIITITIAISLLIIEPAFADKNTATSTNVMQGFPPERASQVTLKNYREYPMNRWAFRNAGAPMHVVMIPRQGLIFELESKDSSPIRKSTFIKLDETFEQNYTDGLVVVHGNSILHENYFGDFNADSQHIWFSMTKSLVSTAFGLLVNEGKVDLTASPVKYIPELKGSGFERVTIQNVLDHTTAISFKENYTDINSDFALHYAPALSMGWLPGAADASPDEAKIYGIHDFLRYFIKPDLDLEPGTAFDYNSSNADLLGWLIARISGQSLQDYIQQNIWSKLGAEHDAYITVDRAYMPVATGGMNTTIRDAARFGMMIRDKGLFNGEVVIPESWVNASLEIRDTNRDNMKSNPKYADEAWSAYHNMWWILDEKIGEYCAVGIHGQVIYINRLADAVIVWFSSRPTASSAHNPVFTAKLKAARELAASLGTSD